MPTVPNIPGPYGLFFYSFDGHEPPHVHVRRERMGRKFWLEVTDKLIMAHLADGRTISVPLVWSWRLSNTTPAQRQHFEIIGTGQRVHWPDKINYPAASYGVSEGR